MDNSTPSTPLTDVPPPADDPKVCREIDERHHGNSETSLDSLHATPSSVKTGLSVRKIRSAMAELCFAIRGALDDERSAAEDSLRRAAQLLQEIGEPQAASRKEVRGGLSPWQIRKVSSYVELHLEQSIRNEELATIVRLNLSHFGRAFRNSFGEPPHEYVIRRRVERAQGLMLSTDAPLSDIALECGLSDQAHLSRLFRRMVGESPRAWRRARLDTSGSLGTKTMAGLADYGSPQSRRASI